MVELQILSVYDEAFRPYGRVWDSVPAALTAPIVAALEARTPLPVGTAYVVSEPALQELPEAAALAVALYGGRPTQFGWCNGHNTRLNCLEYHRASEFNLGTRDFVLMLARREELCHGQLDTAAVRAFRVPAGVLVEVFATTLHYAPCHVDAAAGFKVMVALPEGTNGPKPEVPAELAAAGDAPLLWAADKWLIAHVESDEAAQGAHVGLVGENIDIANMGQ